jgi:polyhydroxybutyrate depolymerase
MKKNILSLVFVIAMSASFAADVRDSFIVDAVYRNYIVHLPTSFNAANQYPLVLNLHGYTSNADQQMLYSGMNATADANNFIVVYPNGVANYWNAFGNGADDVKFLDSLIEKLSRTYNIDRTSVYGCGMSNGGFMSYSLACQLSHEIAAIASVTGTMSNWNLANCPISRKVPVMQIHGTTDPTVDYNTGVSAWGSVGVEASLLFWIDTNSCSLVSDTIDVPNTNVADNCTAQLIRYRSCAQGSEVYFYKILGGEHTWPGAPITIGVTNRDFNASTEIWNFFKRHKLQTATGIETIEDENKLNVFPNPFSNRLSINIENAETASVTIYNSLGAIVYNGNVKSESVINTQNWSSGIYFVTAKTTQGTNTKKLIKGE